MVHFLQLNSTQLNSTQLNSNTLNIIASPPCSRRTGTRFTIYRDKFYKTPFPVIYRERRFLFLPVEEIKITENPIARGRSLLINRSMVFAFWMTVSGASQFS